MPSERMVLTGELVGLDFSGDYGEGTVLKILIKDAPRLGKQSGPVKVELEVPDAK